MPKICFAIVLNEWTNKQYEYEIRFNNLKHYLEIRFNSSMSGSNDEDDENLDVYDTESFRISPLRKISPKNYERVINKGFV